VEKEREQIRWRRKQLKLVDARARRRRRDRMRAVQCSGRNGGRPGSNFMHLSLVVGCGWAFKSLRLPNE
jgi:hypothetical protein